MRLYPIKELVPESFYLACSGGVDSIACLHLMAKRARGRVKAFHFNHKFQPINTEMQKSVVDLCAYLGIECVVKENTNTAITGKGIEDSLRTERMNAYKSLNSDVVACQHLDDAAESYLMNCFTGTPEHLPIPMRTKFDNSDYALHRPFLVTEKRDFIEYARLHDLDKYVVEDPTNHCQDYRRNWVRNSLIPQMAEKQIGVKVIVVKRYMAKLGKTDG